MDAGSGGGVGGLARAVGAEVPGLGGGTKDGDALAAGFEAGHGLARGGGDAPGWADWLGDGRPLAVALVGFEGVEVPGEVAGRDFLRCPAGGAPAVAGRAFGDEFAADGDDIRHAGDEGGPLLHEGGSFFVGHVPELGDGLGVEGLFFVEVFEFGDAGPGSDAASLDGIPGPGAPGFVLAVGGAVENVASVVGLLNEAAGVAGVDGVGRIGLPREMGQRGAHGAVDADADGSVIDIEKLGSGALLGA